MTPIKQRHLDDCVRACVASIFNLSYEETPDFDAVSWYFDLRTWLEPRGIVPVNFYVTEDTRANWPPVVGLGAVESTREGWNHCVVTVGEEIIWDPRMDDAPEPGEKERRLVELTFFVMSDAGKLAPTMKGMEVGRK